MANALPGVSYFIGPAMAGSTTNYVLSKMWSKVDSSDLVAAVTRTTASSANDRELSLSTSSSSSLVFESSARVVSQVRTITTWVPTACVSLGTLSSSLLSWKIAQKFAFVGKRPMIKSVVGFGLNVAGLGCSVVVGSIAASAMSVSVAKKEVVFSLLDAVGFRMPWSGQRGQEQV